MIVEIDEHSGFCFGVVNAIRKAEEELEKGVLYCVGDIVHNDLEVERLQRKGLRTIGHAEFTGLRDCRVLFGLMESLRFLMSWLYVMEWKSLMLPVRWC